MVYSYMRIKDNEMKTNDNTFRSHDRLLSQGIIIIIIIIIYYYYYYY